MSCDTCGSTYNNQQRQRQTVVDQAKAYAKDNQVEVALYQEAGEWKFGTVEYLQSAGIPFREVISQYS